MSFIDDFRPLASELLRAMAAPATLTRVTRAYDPETAGSIETTEDYAALGVLTGPGEGVSVEAALSEGQNAIIGEIAGGAQPQVDDVLSIGAVSMRVRSVLPIRPDGAAIIWRLVLGEGVMAQGIEGRGIEGLGEFLRGLQADARAVPVETRDVMRKLAADILDKLVWVSPVDTGRFRGNWQVGLNFTPEGVLDTAGESEAGIISRGVGVIDGAPAFSTIEIVNNLPYAARLNDGWSRQAPAGFVEAAVDLATEPLAGAFT